MSEVKEIEQNIEALKAQIALKDQVLKLERNRDFRSVILEGFCVKEAATYVQLSADPNLGKSEREDALALAQASGHIKRYLEVLKAMGFSAENQLPRYEQGLLEARQEEEFGEE